VAGVEVQRNHVRFHKHGWSRYQVGDNDVLRTTYALLCVVVVVVVVVVVCVEQHHHHHHLYICVCD
jgi:hypothetical protein